MKVKLVCKSMPHRAGTFFKFTLVPLLCLLSCIAQDNPSSGAGSDLDQDVKDRVNNLANFQKNLTDINTPGAELWAEEESRDKTPVGTMVRYELFTKNLPQRISYTLSLLKMNQESVPVGGAKTVNSAGQVMDGPDDPVIVVAEAARGEPLDFVLESKNGKYKAAAQVIPFPIMASDKGCSVEAILLMPNAEAVLVRANGFQPNGTVQFDGDSAGEMQNGELRTDERGRRSFVLLPYKKDTKKGQMKVTLRSETCRPSVSFFWGEGTYRVE